ncbi:MAG: uracil-DNA glycosylase family protein [Burkholderiaceae bacterium]
MTRLSQLGRRRLVEALGLGPLWVRRASAPVGEAVDIEADVSTLDWETLRQMVASGRAWGLRSAQLPEFGASRPEWLVIGGPAVDDDANDEAFAGSAGRLLDAMLAAIGLDRDRSVVVAGLAKYGAHATGVAISRSCLERQIELLAPRMILVVGEFAVTAMFPGAPSFDDFRGNEEALTIVGRTVPVVATFHPSRLLVDGLSKAQAWADLCLARTIHEERSATVFA